MAMLHFPDHMVPIVSAHHALNVCMILSTYVLKHGPATDGPARGPDGPVNCQKHLELQRLSLRL